MGIYEMITGIPEEPIKYEPMKVKDLEDDRSYCVKSNGSTVPLKGSSLKSLFNGEHELSVFGLVKLNETQMTLMTARKVEFYKGSSRAGRHNAEKIIAKSKKRYLNNN